MDTSETYIRMCEKAEEIQQIAVEKANNNDFDTKNFVKLGVHSAIWLPRQDQLQEMSGGWPIAGFIDWQEWLGHVYGSNYGNKPNGHLHIFNSWEQLWLAFVMKEKYGKTWSGSEWITG